jgi:phosphopantothenoylcysteine decarboxylase/phosphopantothenate--cysteine ligase
MRLSGKHILLGVTGSIAAYKAAELCRLLVKEGAVVRVVMTSSAATFISPLTLSTLSKNPVELHMVNQDNTWNNHVELGLWADLMLVAPASANTLAKMATGVCDNLLLATYLSARCPVMIAPAMDHDMFLHAATQQNLEQLKERGHILVGPAKGELASGLIGEGRLEEPALILSAVNAFFSKGKLAGKKVMVTAGPTIEAIDPVRYISNHSTGKMGVALAQALYHEGATVYLISGPLQVQVPDFLTHIKVRSAEEMYEKCVALFPTTDIAIMAAAVADYTPSHVASEKVKKKDTEWNLELTRTKDIAEALGKMKSSTQLLVGFALETNNEMENAESKLKKKNLDLVVLNSLRDEGSGFAHDTNKITILDRDMKTTTYTLKKKSEVAVDIVTKIIELTHA